MQRNLRGYVLGSFLMGAMGFAACSSDDEGDDIGVGGSDVGGAAGAKTGTTGKVGGAGPTGGTTAKGGAGGATSGPTSSSAQGGSTSPGSSATGGSTTTSTTVAAGAPGNGGSSAQGGSSQAAGSPATGGVAPTGGTTAAGGVTGVAGNAGNAGADPGVAGAAGASSSAPPPVWPFDALDGWTTTTQAQWGSSIVDATTFTVSGGVGTLTIPFTAGTQVGMIAVGGVNANLTGKTITVRIRHVSGGKAAGENIAFTTVATIQDANYTGSSVEGSQFTAVPVADEFSEFTYAVPAAAGDFDPVSVTNIRFSIRADTWGTPAATPTTAVFAIDSITYN